MEPIVKVLETTLLLEAGLKLCVGDVQAALEEIALVSEANEVLREVGRLPESTQGSTGPRVHFFNNA